MKLSNFHYSWQWRESDGAWRTVKCWGYWNGRSAYRDRIRYSVFVPSSPGSVHKHLAIWLWNRHARQRHPAAGPRTAVVLCDGGWMMMLMAETGWHPQAGWLLSASFTSNIYSLTLWRQHAAGCRHSDILIVSWDRDLTHPIWSWCFGNFQPHALTFRLSTV